MKKWLILVVGFLLFQVNSYAQMIPVDYTGNEVEDAADLPSLGGFTTLHPGSGLLGGITNDYITEEGFQFTVSNPETVKYLSINAQQVPFMLYDPTSPQYNNPQSMNVTFSLIEGSYVTGKGFTAPNGIDLVSADITFSTENSHNIESFNGITIPFQTQLDPGNTYWIVATDPAGGEESNLDYSTNFYGPIVTPEPSTVALFGLGLFLLFWKTLSLRRFSKV